MFYFEKGPGYYWHDGWFLLKFGAFVAAGLISIYPTLTFFPWNPALKAGTAPQVPAARAQRVRMC